jgi:hypothetical protein
MERISFTDSVRHSVLCSIVDNVFSPVYDITCTSVSRVAIFDTISDMLLDPVDHASAARHTEAGIHAAALMCLVV